MMSLIIPTTVFVEQQQQQLLQQLWSCMGFGGSSSMSTSSVKPKAFRGYFTRYVYRKYCAGIAMIAPMLVPCRNHV